MGNFNRDNRSGGRSNFNKNRQMFKATCSKCGRDCEVPFQPTGSKPVYCSDCFRAMGGPVRRFDDRNSRRSSFDSRGASSPQPQFKEQFESLNAKLDKIIRLLSQGKSEGEENVMIANTQIVKKKVKMKRVESAKGIAETPADLKVEIPAK